jgi:hypothetical protein
VVDNFRYIQKDIDLLLFEGRSSKVMVTFSYKRENLNRNKNKIKTKTPIKFEIYIIEYYTSF